MSLAPHPTGPGCGDLPELARLSYFHGQPLSAHDLRREQAFHRDRARLHNRLLHGWGVVCGLDVVVPEPRATAECDGAPTHAEVVVLPGAALDCAGDEILVRHPRPVRLADLLTREQAERLAEEPARAHLGICFQEVPIDPTRPLLPGECGPTPDCRHARVLDSYRLVLSLEPFDRGPACEPCCGGCGGYGGCGERCVELAVIEELSPHRPLEPGQVDVSGRRVLARHELTEVVGVSWAHGATYTLDGANALLDGMEVWFSRGVRVDSLRPGVVDLTVVEGGAGRSAATYVVHTELVDLPADGLTHRVRFRSTTGETLQHGDRLVVTLRAGFVLDECCRAVDGDHLGGGVPHRGDEEALRTALARPLEEPPCPARPSGDGVEGGDFVSWVFVAPRGHDQAERQERS